MGHVSGGDEDHVELAERSGDERRADLAVHEAFLFGHDRVGAGADVALVFAGRDKEFLAVHRNDSTFEVASDDEAGELALGQHLVLQGLFELFAVERGCAIGHGLVEVFQDLGRTIEVQEGEDEVVVDGRVVPVSERFAVFVRSLGEDRLLEEAVALAENAQGLLLVGL